VHFAWTIDCIAQTEHCIGFGAPVVNGNWNSLTNNEKLLRASVVGVAGKRLEMDKDSKKGTPQAQADRGNESIQAKPPKKVPIVPTREIFRSKIALS
jgi:hypothetical protein